MKKEMYEAPEIEMIVLEDADLITASTNLPEDNLPLPGTCLLNG